LTSTFAGVTFDGPRAEERLRADLWVRAPLARDSRAVQLLGVSWSSVLTVRLAHGLTDRHGLAARSVGKCLGAHRVENVVSGTGLLARFRAAVLATQPLA
jgi:hypothetical protein